MAAAITIIRIPSCAAAIGSCRWMFMCPAARQPPRHWSTASCNCRRKSAAPGRSSVADEAQTVAGPTALEVLGQAVATLPGVRDTSIRLGELIAHAERDGFVALMTTLRDDPRFAFEQLMD